MSTTPSNKNGARIGLAAALIVCCCMGTGMLIFGYLGATGGAEKAQADYEHAAALPVFTAAGLPQAESGEEVLIEGTISSDNALRLGTFVAYTMGEIQDTPCVTPEDSGCTTTVYTNVTPPLHIQTSDGSIDILNSDYHAEQFPVYQKDPANKALFYYGLEVGTAVTVVGTVKSGRIDATELLMGTREDYLHTLQNVAQASPWIGAGIMLCGAFFLGLAVFLV